MPDPVTNFAQLSLEQQASLAVYAQQVEQMSAEQIKEELLSVTRLLLHKDNLIKTLTHWKANGSQVSPSPRSC